MSGLLQSVPHEQRRLLVELAFCAVNNGMIAQAECIMSVFPLLIEDRDTCIRCQILLLIGLQQFKEAETLLQQLPAEQQADFAMLFGNR